MSGLQTAGLALLLAPHAVGVLALLIGLVLLIPAFWCDCVVTSRGPVQECDFHARTNTSGWCLGGMLTMHFGWLAVWGFAADPLKRWATQPKRFNGFIGMWKNPDGSWK